MKIAANVPWSAGPESVHNDDNFIYDLFSFLYMVPVYPSECGVLFVPSTYKYRPPTPTSLWDHNSSVNVVYPLSVRCTGLAVFKNTILYCLCLFGYIIIVISNRPTFIDGVLN